MYEFRKVKTSIEYVALFFRNMSTTIVKVSCYLNIERKRWERGGTDWRGITRRGIAREFLRGDEMICLFICLFIYLFIYLFTYILISYFKSVTNINLQQCKFIWNIAVLQYRERSHVNKIMSTKSVVELPSLRN